MKMHIFTVHDAKVEAYLTPFFARTRGEALRMFQAACQNPEHDFAKHGEDYTLFHLGDYNDEDGSFYTNSTPIPMVKAIDLANGQRDQEANT